MHKSNKFALANILQFSLDISFLILTYFLAYFIAGKLTTLYVMVHYLWILIIFIPIWVSVMALNRMYDKTTFYYPDRVLRSIIFASLFSGLGLGTMLFFVKETSTSRLFIGVFFLLCVFIMCLERFGFGLFYRLTNTNSNSPRMIIVSSEEDTPSIFKYLRKTHIRYNIIGTVLVGGGNTTNSEFNLGNLENLGEILKSHVVDQVLFYMPNDYAGGVEKYVLLCERMGVTVNVVLNPYDLQLSHVYISMLGPLPVLTFHTVIFNPVQQAIKRTMDIVGSLVGLVFTLVAAIIIVPAIKLDSPGPIIFKQQRVGRYGRIFNIYKFRTMCIDAEDKKKALLDMNEHKNGLMFKIKEDPRITQVGAFLRKTSLDEVPQFFNVLKGDMSLVGTRPPTLDEVGQYDCEHWRRISIKPGLTGMWQVNGRSDIDDFEDVVALDTRYIDEWSVWLDVDILIKTISRVIKMKSAC